MRAAGLPGIYAHQFEQCKLFVWLFPVKPAGETISPWLSSLFFWNINITDEGSKRKQKLTLVNRYEEITILFFNSGKEKERHNIALLPFFWYTWKNVVTDNTRQKRFTQVANIYHTTGNNGNIVQNENTQQIGQFKSIIMYVDKKINKHLNSVAPLLYFSISE